MGKGEGKGTGKGTGMGRGGSMECRWKTVLAFGIIQIIIGAIVLICGIVIIARKSVVSNLAHGITGGIWILLTGILGLVGGLKRRKGLVIAFMVLSIISACIVWLGMLLISAGGAVGDTFFTHKDVYNKMDTEAKLQCALDARSRIDGSTPDVPSDQYMFPCTNYSAATANFVILIMAGLLLLIAIFAASFSCCAICKCCGANPDASVQPIQGGGYPNYGYA